MSPLYILLGGKYQPIWVWVSVLDLNQNSGFSCALAAAHMTRNWKSILDIGLRNSLLYLFCDCRREVCEFTTDEEPLSPNYSAYLFTNNNPGPPGNRSTASFKINFQIAAILKGCQLTVVAVGEGGWGANHDCYWPSGTYTRHFNHTEKTGVWLEQFKQIRTN